MEPTEPRSSSGGESSGSPHHLTRRALIGTFLATGAAGVAGLTAVVAERVTKYLDRLWPAPPKLPSGRPSNNPLDWLRDLFGEWSTYRAAPGIDNPDYVQRGVLHPDILEPFKHIVPLWLATGESPVPTELAHLPDARLTDSLVLIGGPVSNSYSRKWQGYSRSPKTGIFEYCQSKLNRRWRFEYDLKEPKESGPARFVDGKLHRSWPQAIYDEQESRYLPRRVHGHDRLLTEDWLILSFVPNVMSLPSRPAAIVDASDLHGQGNKAFADLVNKPDRLDELVKKLTAKGIRPSSYFQALYRVHVKHKNMQTIMKDYQLVDVSMVKS